jgi:hypothetical protein
VHPVPDPLHFFFLVVPGIEPGPPDLWPRTLTTRPQRRSPGLDLGTNTIEVLIEAIDNGLKVKTKKVPTIIKHCAVKYGGWRWKYNYTIVDLGTTWRRESLASAPIPLSSRKGPPVPI